MGEHVDPMTRWRAEQDVRSVRSAIDAIKDQIATLEHTRPVSEEERVAWQDREQSPPLAEDGETRNMLEWAAERAERWQAEGRMPS